MEYTYLGTVISQDGKIDVEITKRIQKATNTSYAISGTIFGKKEINKKTKTRLYNAIIEPVLMYGSESWPTQNKHISRATAVQMKVLRRIIGKTKRDRIRNERITSELNQEPIATRIERRQLKWFGHVHRMNETRKPKQYLIAKPEGNKTRGRQRKTYIDVIAEYGRKRGKSLKEMEKLAKNRETWKKVTTALPTL